MTIEQLRFAVGRTLRGITDDAEVLDELVSIADHHAAEEVAAAVSDAALAERERIARLADQCWATYDWKFQPCTFGSLIRSGATRPPWIRPEPLPADDRGDAA